MGMAASQARLLMLTARLHDLEFEAQSIQNAKVQLSTQQDAVYEEYQRALDDTTLTFTMMDPNSAVKSTVMANFNNLFSVNRANEANGNHYLLIDSRGRVVVDDEIYEGLNNYKGYWGGDVYSDNAYQFAWYMVEGQRYGHWANGGNDSPSALMTAIDEVFEENKDTMSEKYESIVAEVDNAYGGRWWANNSADPNEPSLSVILARIQCDETSGSYSDEQKEIFNELINYFWSHFGQTVFNRIEEGSTNMDGDEYKSSEFNYYVEIYNAVQQHGGYISIEEFNGPNGSAAHDSEWLTNMVQAGQMSIELIQIDKTGEAKIDGVSVASDSDLTYTTTTQIDKVAMAKAEAKYEHEMKLIDKKDQKFDLALSKLETERNALTKQYDSIKKVAEDNIDRTFGIFS